MQRIWDTALYIIKATSEMKKLLLSSILLLGIFSAGCYKDSDNSSEVIITERPDIKIGTSIHGVATDASGSEMVGYDLIINGERFAADQEVYYLDLTHVNKKNQHIAIEKDDVKVAFANVSLIENDVNKINFHSFPAYTTSQINASENLITLNNNYQIDINSSDLSADSEMEHWIFSDTELLQQLGTWGTDVAANDYFLHGLSAFHLYSENVIVDKNTLKLNYDLTGIDAENLSLFHLNENFHQWILVEEMNAANGVISLSGLGSYLIAEKTPSAFVEGSLNFEDLPLSFQDFQLSVDNDKTLSMIASAKGKWASHLPKDFLSLLSINNPCDEPVAEEELNILEDGQNFITSLTSSNTENIIPLNFENVDCDGTTLEVPGALIEFSNNESILIFPETSVETAIITCGDVLISGYNIEENIQGPSIPWNAEIEDLIDYLAVCDEYSEGYSYLEINGEMELLEPFTLEKENGRSILKSEDDKIRLIIQGQGTGEYLENQVNFFIDDEDFGGKGYRMFCENSPVGCGFDDCFISHYEEMGDGLTRVTFSGTLWMQTIADPTAGNYEVEGQIITRQ